MQIDQAEDVSADEAVGGVELTVKKLNQGTNPSKMHFPFVCFPLPVCAAKTERDLTSWKEALNSKHLEALEDHQGSLCPFIAQVFLSAPCSSSALLFLFCSTWSVRALGGCLITLIHTHTHAHADRSRVSGDASFSFRSHQQRLPRRALAHCKVMLKYFRTEVLSVFQNCSFSSAAAAQNSKANFRCLWEKRTERL